MAVNYTGQLALGTHFDLNKILGWQDTEAQITVTYRDGQSFLNILQLYWAPKFCARSLGTWSNLAFNRFMDQEKIP
jgi:hypothetical protein